MISEFSLHAKPSNKKAVNVVRACLAIAFISMAAMTFIDRYRGIAGMAAFILIITALFFYTKFISAEYIYDITTDGDGKPIFVVRSRTGKRETTLFRIDFTAIKKAECKTAEDMKLYQPDTGVIKYSFCPSLAPEKIILLTVRSRYEKSDVLIEAPDDFMEYINTLAAEAATAYPDED